MTPPTAESEMSGFAYACGACGRKWRKIPHGGHECIERVRSERDALRALVAATVAWAKSRKEGAWSDSGRNERKTVLLDAARDFVAAERRLDHHTLTEGEEGDLAQAAVKLADSMIAGGAWAGLTQDGECCTCGATIADEDGEPTQAHRDGCAFVVYLRRRGGGA